MTPDNPLDTITHKHILPPKELFAKGLIGWVSHASLSMTRHGIKSPQSIASRIELYVSQPTMYPVSVRLCSQDAQHCPLRQNYIGVL